jgi:hypothetical protein
MKNFILFGFLTCLVSINFSCKDEPCDGVTCQHDGVCNDGTCTCSGCYEGEFCEILQRDKFIGSYAVISDVCVGTYSMNITQSSTSDCKIVINNLNNNSSINLVATVSNSNSFTIDNQVLASGQNISGNGTINGNVLSINYAGSGGNFPPFSCSASCNKQ